MTAPGKTAAIVLALFFTGATSQLAAQARIGGGGRGGGGVRSGGGGIAAPPGRLGGGAGPARGLGGSDVGAGRRVGAGATLNPRGYIGAAATNAPFAQGPSARAPRAPQTPAQGSTPRASVGSAVSRTFVSVPHGRPSIPPLGDSIPPLESSGRHQRPRIDPGNIRGIGGFDRDFDADFDFGRRGGRGFGQRFPVVYLPFGYGYSDYSSHTEHIVVVDHQTSTASSASVQGVPQYPAPEEEPAGAKIIELRPRDPDSEPAAPGSATQDPSSVEVLRGSEAEGGQDRAALYLIARGDGVIVTSQEQWIAGNSVHYITPQGERRQILIENLDLDLSARLNRERGLSFTLEVLPGK